MTVCTELFSNTKLFKVQHVQSQFCYFCIALYLKKASKAKFYQDLNKACRLEELLNKVAVKLKEQFQVPLTSDIQFNFKSEKKQEKKVTPTHHGPLYSLKTGQKKCSCLKTRRTSLSHSLRVTLLLFVAGTATTDKHKIVINTHLPIEAHS